MKPINERQNGITAGPLLAACLVTTVLVAGIAGLFDAKANMTPDRIASTTTTVHATPHA
jgi:hypothetical protein